MKFFTFILLAQCLLLHSALGEFSLEKHRQIHNLCVEKTGCDEDTIDRGRKGDFDPNPKFKNFLKCVIEEQNGFNPDGTINVDGLLGSFTEELFALYDKPIKECVSKVEFIPNTPDYAYNFLYCIYEITLQKFGIP